MLKPTREEVQAAAADLSPATTGNLTAEDQIDARLVIRQIKDYNATDYPNVETRLADVAGYEAAVILASVRKIDALGQSMAAINVDQGLVTRKKDDEREGFGRTILALLWDGAATAGGMTLVSVTLPLYSNCGSEFG